MLNSRSGKLKALTVMREKLTNEQIEEMYAVFSKYYLHTSRDIFEEDLAKKEAVFLLVDSGSLEIMGFSTIQGLETEIGKKRVRGLFSGDTIIEKEYWGQGALGIAFLKYLFLKKVRRPFTPLYWFLISKGYKTYLLMANNFKEHYPRYEKETPENKKKILDAFSKQLFPSYYCPETGIISFSQKSISKDALKCEVTPITQEMLLKNPRIQYFADKNPTWDKGDELACIAEMTLLMPFQYQLKVMKKRYTRMRDSLLEKGRRAFAFLTNTA